MPDHPTAAPSALRLDAADNVAVALRPLAAGERIAIDGLVLVMAEAIELGHKVATSPIPEGGLVKKFGMPIGAATSPIAAGQWVHVHNIRSLTLTNDWDHHEPEGSR